MDQHGAQVTVPAFADAQYPNVPTGADVAWHQTQPGGELATGPERLRIAHGGHHRGGREHADTGDLLQAPAGLAGAVPQQ